MSFNSPLFTIGIINACNDLLRYVNKDYYLLKTYFRLRSFCCEDKVYFNKVSMRYFVNNISICLTALLKCMCVCKCRSEWVLMGVV